MKIRLRASRLVLSMVLFAGMAAAYIPASRPAAAAPPPSVLGFAYWPTGHDCDVLTNANWNVYKPLIAADLDHMASLGTGVIKLVFHPKECGWGNLPGYSWEFALDPSYYEMVQNFPDFLRLAAARNIKVIVVFSNSWFYCGPNANPSVCAADGRGQWWEQAGWYKDYPLASDPHEQGRFAAFLGNSNAWISGLVEHVEGSNQVSRSPYANTVLYYDYQNEFHKWVPNMGWYLTFLYDWSRIPAGKRGVSVLWVRPQNIAQDDVADLQYQLSAGASRHLDFVGFHSYPTGNPVVNPNIEDAYDYTKGRFPNSIVLLDEFGYSADFTWEEDAQREGVINFATRARNHQIPYYMNWLFDGDVFGQHGHSWGYGGRDDPKHIMGAFPQRVQSTVWNPDMEGINGSRPWHWSADGSIPVQFYAGGPDSSDAATGDWYARMRITGYSSGSAWIYSDQEPVRGGDRLYVNGYIRSNMANISMKVIEFDGYGNRLPDGPETSGPGVGSTPGWHWYNYLAAGASGREGWSVGLRGETRSIIIMVYANVTYNDSILDLDTISAWEAVP